MWTKISKCRRPGFEASICVCTLALYLGRIAQVVAISVALSFYLILFLGLVDIQSLSTLLEQGVHVASGKTVVTVLYSSCMYVPKVLVQRLELL